MAKMTKADEAKGAKTDDGKTDYDETFSAAKPEEGKDTELNEDVGKSEDKTDEEHVDHPRPEAGEEEQKDMDKSDENDEEDEKELEADAEKNRDEQEIEAKKSLTAEDLDKSIARLEAFADHKPEDRKAKLLAKASKGEDLSKSELTELSNLLGGKKEEKPTLTKSATAGYARNDKIQKALDVSDYLSETNKELVKSLTMLASHVEKSDNRQQEFNIMLAKTMANVGRLVKSVSDRLSTIEKQPARAPKSAGLVGNKIIEKSTQESGATQMSKAEVLNAMDGMLEKAHKVHDYRVAGEDLSVAAAKFENSGMISPAMYRAVEQFTKENKK